MTVRDPATLVATANRLGMEGVLDALRNLYTVDSGGRPLLAEGMGRSQLVDSATPSGASDVTFTLGSLPRYQITGWVLPASDAIFYLRVGVAASIKSGASDYNWTSHVFNATGVAGGAAQSDVADSEIQLSGASSIGGAAAEGAYFEIDIIAPANTTLPARVEYLGRERGSTAVLSGHRTIGEYAGGTDAVDTIQLLFPSVNMSGEIYLWGLGS